MLLYDILNEKLKKQVHKYWDAFIYAKYYKLEKDFLQHVLAIKYIINGTDLRFQEEKEKISQFSHQNNKSSLGLL